MQEVWSRLLRHEDRFVSLDSALFLDEDITSREYVLRYAQDVVWDEADLLSLTGAADLLAVEDVVYAEADFDGDLRRTEDGLELYLSGAGYEVPYPFRWSELVARAVEAQEEADVVDE